MRGWDHSTRRARRDLRGGELATPAAGRGPLDALPRASAARDELSGSAAGDGGPAPMAMGTEAARDALRVGPRDRVREGDEVLTIRCALPHGKCGRLLAPAGGRRGRRTEASWKPAEPFPFGAHRGSGTRTRLSGSRAAGLRSSSTEPAELRGPARSDFAADRGPRDPTTRREEGPSA